VHLLLQTPDQAALAAGISEALINTATGIGTSAAAIISYNFFTSKIDDLTYSIDEAAVSIVNHLQFETIIYVGIYIK
jgi:biopolymer transport protein ExbB